MAPSPSGTARLESILVLLVVSVFLAVFPSRSNAQAYFTADQIVPESNPVYVADFKNTVTLSVTGTKEIRYPLESRYCGSGMHWIVRFELDTGGTYDYCVSVPAADGQSSGRILAPDVFYAPLSTGTMSFFGDDNPQAQPKELRFTFKTESSGSYVIKSCHLEVFRITGAGLAGPLRETPIYLQAGTERAPACTRIPLYLRNEHQAFQLFYLEPGFTLKARFSNRTQSGRLHFSVWNQDHELLKSSIPTRAPISVPGGGVEERLAEIYTNDLGTGRFVIVGYYPLDELPDCTMKFYCDNGASPAIGSARPAPPARELNPYIPIESTYESFEDLFYSTTKILLPQTPLISGLKSMLRLRVRVQQTPFLTRQSGVNNKVEIFSRDNSGLATGVAVGFDTPRGHEPNEYFYELDGSTSDHDLPWSLILRTSISRCKAEVEATRYIRRARGDERPPTVYIATPVAGSTVRDPWRVDVFASDDFALAKVVLQLDGESVGSDASRTSGLRSFPIQRPWLANGRHTLVAKAIDTYGNEADSDSVDVEVATPGIRITSPGTGAYWDTRVPLALEWRATEYPGFPGFTSVETYVDGVFAASGPGNKGTISVPVPKNILPGSHTITLSTQFQGARLKSEIRVETAGLSIVTDPAGPLWDPTKELSVRWLSRTSVGFVSTELYLNGVFAGRVSTPGEERLEGSFVRKRDPAGTTAVRAYTFQVFGKTRTGELVSAQTTLSIPVIRFVNLRWGASWDPSRPLTVQWAAGGIPYLRYICVYVDGVPRAVDRSLAWLRGGTLIVPPISGVAAGPHQLLLSAQNQALQFVSAAIPIVRSP